MLQIINVSGINLKGRKALFSITFNMSNGSLSVVKVKKLYVFIFEHSSVQLLSNLIDSKNKYISYRG